MDEESKRERSGASKIASQGYYKFFAGLGNKPPNWSLGEVRPKDFACTGPWLPSRKDVRILDFGCGLGHMMFSMWCAGYRNIEGVEIDRGQFEIATQSAGGRCKFNLADGFEFLSQRIEEYDLVVVCDVIQHFDKERVRQLLALISQCLRPGGTVFIRTPNMASVLAGYSRYLDFENNTGFTEFSLAYVLAEAGFRGVSFVADNTGWYPSQWRPWAPLRGLGVRWLLNRILHSILYGVRTQFPHPTRYGYNLEVYASKASG
jgi:2-polyprenyl-3-methyl-5-hydroxy-6-metoxy-1,4-benzoquinol methylase